VSYTVDKPPLPFSVSLAVRIALLDEGMAPMNEVIEAVQIRFGERAPVELSIKKTLREQLIKQGEACGKGRVWRLTEKGVDRTLDDLQMLKLAMREP